MELESGALALNQEAGDASANLDAFQRPISITGNGCWPPPALATAAMTTNLAGSTKYDEQIRGPGNA